MEKLKSIKFLQDADSLVECNGEGHSVDEKFLAIKNGKKYFVKLTKNYINPNLKNIFEKANILHTPIIDIGKLNDKYYIIQEYCQYESLRQHLDTYTEVEIYNFMYSTGSKFSNLRKQFIDKNMTDSEYENFLQYLFQMLNTFYPAYKKCDTFSKENQQTFLKIRDYLIENISVLKACPCVFGHPDIHPGNFLISEKGLICIDYDSTAYSNIAIAILWGLLSDNIDNLEKYLSFTSGYLNGLFSNNIPTSVVEGINVIFAFIVLRYILKFLNKNQADKAEMYIIKTKKYFKGNKFNLFSRLTNKNPPA